MIRRIEYSLPWVLLALVGIFAIRRLDNSDTWWHLASGRWIVENGTVPHTDTLSFTVPGNDWINLQWLYDLVLYLVHQAAGAHALVLLSAAACVATFAFVILHLRRSLGPWAATAIAAWVLLASHDRFVIRPEMFSFLLLQAVLWLLARAKENEGRLTWLLVPLMALWANLHALFVIGAFCIGCAAVAALLADYAPLPRGWREGTALGGRARNRLLLAAVSSLAVTFVNPYLARGALFPFKLLSRFGESSPFSSIGEFQSPFMFWFSDPITGPYQALFLFSIAVVLLAALYRSDLADLLVFAGLAWISVLAYRNTALFALGIAPLLGRALAVLRARFKLDRWECATPVRAATALAALAALAATGWFVASNRYYRWDGRTHEFGLGVLESNFPIHAAAFVEEHDLPGPIYNDLTAGGYLTWARPNGEKVFIDGRLEVYDDFFARYSAALRDPVLWSAQVENFGINTVLLFHGWGNRHPMIGWLNDNPEWSLVYFDEVAVVFLRSRGNDEVIAEARAAFQEWYAATLRRLNAAVPTWSYPAGRVVAWDRYGALFETLGDADNAAGCRERSRQLGRL
jgi:hypothetical protein